ncbi:hypothetical protein [Enhygromyxa salina]|nr:hypothetical protein [Enhygromyxa salina]
MSFELEGSIARSHDRPELLAIARLAADAPAGLTGDLLARELFGSQPALCKAVIERCVKIGLLERRSYKAPAQLTFRGHQMLASGQIRLPEDRTWRVYYVDDPLLDANIVHVEPCWNSNASAARTEVYNQKKHGERAKDPDKCPRPLLEATGENAWSSIVNGSSFELQRLSPRGIGTRTTQARLEVAFSEAGPVVQLIGTLDPPAAPPKTAPAKLNFRYELSLPNALIGWDYDMLWTRLVSVGSRVPVQVLEPARAWAKRRVLPLEWQSTSETDRRTMRRNVEVEAVDLGPLGRFDATRVDDVELIAHRLEDAQMWAVWLQWDGIDNYCIPEGLIANGERVLARFPEFDVKSASPSDLLEYAKRKPNEPTARYILTSSDLGLWS